MLLLTVIALTVAGPVALVWRDCGVILECAIPLRCAEMPGRLKLLPTLRLTLMLILVVRCRKVTQKKAHQAWHRLLGAYALACSWLKLPPTLRLTLKLVPLKMMKIMMDMDMEER